MKSNSFSRRGLLMGAATLAASGLQAAEDQPAAITESVSRGLGSALRLCGLLYRRGQRTRD